MVKKLSEMTEMELQAEISKVDSRMSAISDKMAPLKKMYATATSRKESLRKALAAVKKDDLKFILSDTQAYEQFKKLLPKQTYPDGYWGDTHEQAFKIMLNHREVPSEELIAFIREYVKASKTQRMGIFRYDLCERGIWQVSYTDGKWIIYDATSYSFKYLKQNEFETEELEEMLKYVAARHYYQGPDYERDYDEDLND